MEFRFWPIFDKNKGRRRFAKWKIKEKSSSFWNLCAHIISGEGRSCGRSSAMPWRAMTWANAGESLPTRRGTG